MIPVRDDQPRFSTPYVTYFLIGLNSVIFLFESALTPGSFKTLLYEFGMIPAQHHRISVRRRQAGVGGSIASRADIHVPARLVDAL